MLLWGPRACSTSPCGRMGGLTRKGAARHRQSRRDSTCNASRRDLPLAETLELKITLLFAH